jgi:hypothetical protein
MEQTHKKPPKRRRTNGFACSGDWNNAEQRGTELPLPHLHHIALTPVNKLCCIIIFIRGNYHQR